ncbi:MAG TPA: hypothetical protein VMV28_04870 [Thermoplasmata archaeon]|nr:hypothetical protein [Thermoplasmata archaeon]
MSLFHRKPRQKSWLEQGEFVIKHGPARTEDGDGTLALTNRRLRFARADKRGRVDAINIRLDQVTDAGVVRRALRAPQLVVHAAGADRVFIADSAPSWAKEILSVRSAPSAANPASTRDPATPLTVLIQQAPSQVIERQTVKVRCRYCGSLADESIGKCSSCGAKL